MRRGTEEFRYPPSGSALLGFGALLLLVAMGILIPWGEGLAEVGAVPWTIIGIFIGAGLGLGWIALRRLWRRYRIGPEGLWFPGRSVPVPWSDVAGLRFRAFGGGAEVLDHAGKVHGIIPTELEAFERALLLSSEAITGAGGVVTGTEIAGSHGLVGWAVFLFVLGYSFFEIKLDRLAHAPLYAILVVGLFLLAILWKIVFLWRQTGRFELQIDSAGIRFRGKGRGSDWEARWGEIRQIELHIQGGDQITGPRIAAVVDDRTVRNIPLRGVELHRVFHALRQYGGAVTASLDPPSERPVRSLLKREF